jgi:hypothetical protein
MQNYTINTAFLDMEAKPLKAKVKEVSQQIKEKISELKKNRFSSATKKLNTKYLDELDELNNMTYIEVLSDDGMGYKWSPEIAKMEKEREELYLETIQKIASNSSGKGEEFRLTELTWMLGHLNNKQIDYSRHDNFYSKVNLVILSNISM